MGQEKRMSKNIGWIWTRMHWRAKSCGWEKLDFNNIRVDMNKKWSEGEVRWGVDGAVSTKTGRIWTRMG